MIVRIEMAGERFSATLTDDDLDKLVTNAAHKLVEKLDPYTIAADHLDRQEWREMDSWIDTILHNPKKNGHKYALNMRGVAYHRRQDFAEAIRHFQMAVKLDDAFAYAYINWANTLTAQERQPEAFEIYRKASSIPGRQDIAYRAWAIAVRDYTQYDLCADELKREALGSLPEGVVSFTTDPWDRVDACWILAIDKFRRALASDLDRSSTHNSMGILYRQQKELDLAAHHYAQAVEADSGNAYAWRNWGLLLSHPDYSKHDLKEAERKYRRAIEADHSYIAAYLSLAALLRARGDTEAAIEQYRLLTKLDPVRADAYNGVIDSLRLNGPH